MKELFLTAEEVKMMHANLRYISQAWLERRMFDVVITNIGGMEISHSGFRRSDELAIHSSYDNKNKQRTYRPTFKQLIPAHLAEDFEQCIIHYKDGDGASLGCVDFKQWIFYKGEERKVLAVSDNAKVRVYLPPINRHVVPFGTVSVSFCFEWPGISMKATKYKVAAPIKADLRICSKSNDWQACKSIAS